jgi:hypothetical protein
MRFVEFREYFGQHVGDLVSSLRKMQQDLFRLL